MHTSEWRRLLRVVLPAALSLAAAVLLVATALDIGTTNPPPRITEHWHAVYEYYVCGEKQPNAPTWEGSSGVHTHGDGIIHIHPFQTYSEGRGARLVKWFEYGGGILTDTEVRLPGQDITYHNGDLCPDRSASHVQVFAITAANGVEERLADWSEYIPYDGDRIRIVFGPREVATDAPVVRPSPTPGPTE